MRFAAALLATAVSAGTMTQKFMHYVQQFNKSYITRSEFLARLENFAAMDAFIDYTNEVQKSYTVGHNLFSDMSQDEKDQYTGRMVKKGVSSKPKLVLDTSEVPDAIDWRTVGAVNPIRDQGHCGSCWSFGSVCSMEGAHFIETGELLQFAEQQLVDCSGSYGNNGCGGGLEIWAFAYYEDYSAILRSDYAYTAKDGTCQYDSKPHTSVNATTYDELSGKSSSQVRAAIAKQPISVGIYASSSEFGQYTGGIFDQTLCLTI